MAPQTNHFPDVNYVCINKLICQLNIFLFKSTIECVNDLCFYQDSRPVPQDPLGISLINCIHMFRECLQQQSRDPGRGLEFKNKRKPLDVERVS